MINTVEKAPGSRKFEIFAAGFIVAKVILFMNP